MKKPVAKPTPKPVDPEAEKTAFEKAIAEGSLETKAKEIEKFLLDFPKSELGGRALESLAAARASIADNLLESGEADKAVLMFKQAVGNAPTPYPEGLFNGIISKIPANLFWRGQRTAAFEIAAIIEKNASQNTLQLLAMASFYIGVENGAEAKRIAEAALKLDENSSAAYQTLGLAHRLNFDLEESARSYAKALELDPSSDAAKRSLAEMKRATGKPEEAAALYRELLEKDSNNVPAKTGLVLSLFGMDNRTDAEAELSKTLEANPNNVILLAGASYWYAAVNDNAKAVELAEKAVALEPRYIWSHIALARGQAGQGKLVDSERTLIKARQYGNFPTLEYEIASVRLMLGLYREAAEELQKSFEARDGKVKTKLGGRIQRVEKSFPELIADERRASIFEPKSSDTPENAEKLRQLLDLHQAIANSTPDEQRAADLAGSFSDGNDKMRLHRQLYAASLLLEKKIALTKVLEITKQAVSAVDDGLAISSPTLPVMASEIYDSRANALLRDQFINVPDVPRQTLSAILRGRIEEIAGWTLYRQENYADATVRLLRAISVLPEKSAWWRSSIWKLGTALEADGKLKEALETYIAGYKTDQPSGARYLVIESLYRKVNGNTDGLEEKVGPNPAPIVAASTPERTDDSSDVSATEAKKSGTGETVDTKVKTVIDPPTAEPLNPEQKPTSGSSTEEAVKEKTNASADTAKQSPTKPLFDSVIINVQKDPPKSVEETAKDGEVKVSEPSGEQPKNSEVEKPKEDTHPKPADEPSNSGVVRPRVVAGKEIVLDKPACSITMSQTNASLINNGGSMGILIGIEGEGTVKSVTARSSSPEDVEVKIEPEIGEASGKAFYVIKSISPKMGLFQVIFGGICGPKELVVTVR
ncbi:MAG: tetratricopeptide repeat protein [Blastocatellia bacterium]